MSLTDAFIPGRKDPEMRYIQAAFCGDRSAFDSLVRIYNPQLLGFLARMVGASAAEDVLQETWLAGWSSLRSYRRESRFRAWIYAIAWHKCNDYQRRNLKRLQEEFSDHLPGLPILEDPFDAADRIHAVRAALSTLPDVQREVLKLYFYAELTLPEIAKLLGRNLNTVKYQFYRAHAHAAQSLQEYAPPIKPSTVRGNEAYQP